MNRSLKFPALVAAAFALAGMAAASEVGMTTAKTLSPLAAIDTDIVIGHTHTAGCGCVSCARPEVAAAKETGNEMLLLAFDRETVADLVVTIRTMNAGFDDYSYAVLRSDGMKHPQKKLLEASAIDIAPARDVTAKNGAMVDGVYVAKAVTFRDGATEAPIST